MLRRIISVVLFLSVLSLNAESEEKEGQFSREKLAEFVEKLSSSAVIVEYWFKYDNGETHSSGERYVKEQRPFQIAGFMISENRAVVPDVIFSPRFIDKMTVSYKGKRIAAVPVKYMTAHDAMLIELQEKIPGIIPLAFDSTDKEGALTLEYKMIDGDFVFSINPFSPVIEIKGGEETQRDNACCSFEQKGNPITLIMKEKVAFDDSWKTPPYSWDSISSTELSAAAGKLKDKIKKSILHTSLNFRSPKLPPSNRISMRFDRDEDTSKTEKNTLCIALTDKRVVILEKMIPRVTARLKGINLHLSDNKIASAEFESSLSDWGVLTAVSQEKLPDSIEISPLSIYEKQDYLFFSARIRVQGEEKTVEVQRNRVGVYYRGLKNRLYPVLDGDEGNTFLFDRQGRLLALPLLERKDTASEYGWGSPEPSLTPAFLLAESLKNSSHIDKSNIPLLEKDENRLAWMGIEFQAMNRDLAKVNNVSEYTTNGEIGAIVSYVYKNSPAEKAGVKPGFILLRLNIAGQQQPADIRVDDDFQSSPFPWDQYEQIPSEYLIHMPLPWPPADNSVNVMLTDIGIGKKYEAVFYYNGKILNKAMTIEKMPSHYSAASEYKNDKLGLRIRNITYEVRRYFQLKDSSPGVIVSRTDSGLPAAVAGLKKYEIITHDDGKAVADISDFQKYINGKQELKLNVTRMVKQRVIKIKL